MQQSAEIRWFYPGNFDANMLAWFSSSQSLEAETRIDRYFIFSGCESGGVKLRTYKEKRNFEIKLLRGAAETVRLTPSASGRADCWVKWSYGDDPAHAMVQALMDKTEGFIDVEKKRFLRKFSMDAGSQAVEVDAKQMPMSGCGIELTQLKVNGVDWWTFGFEAFGPAENIQTILRSIASDFFTEHPPTALFSSANSCSYPAWLGGV